MSVGRSLAATTASRVTLAALALLVLPAYRHLLGPEAYGLVTLFLVLQVWFQMLDLGLAATLAREAARHRAHPQAAPHLRALLRTLERLFATVAGVAALVLIALADAVAQHWLTTEQLPAATVVASLRLMALCVVVRLLGDLYRGVLSGFERLVWLAGTNTAFGLLRLVGVMPFLLFTGADPVAFFAYQLTGYVLEAVVLRMYAWRLIPPAAATSAGLKPVRGVIGFALSMSLASAVWAMASQVDKLVLSGLLSLKDFGAYGLAVAAAGGVLILAAALADTLMPRITALQASGARAELEALYRAGTQWAGIVTWSAAGLLACHAERILRVWTGDAALAQSMAPVLALYALGNAALAIAAFPYYLQFARGRLRLHLVGTGLMFALLLPGVVWATARHGAPGAAAVWLAVNSLYLLAWTPLAHARFAPGLHWRWLLGDVAPIALLALSAAAATAALPWPVDRLAAGLLLVPTAAAILLAGAAGSGWARSTLRRRMT